MATAKRAKPRVAHENADAAVANISVKLAYMTAQIELGRTGMLNPNEIAKWLPKSRTAFNNWCATTLPREMAPPQFRKNAAATLKKNKDARGAVDAAITARNRMVQSATKMRDKPSKLESIAALKREVQLLTSMKQIAERELIGYRKRAEKLDSDLQAMRAEGESKTREFDRELALLRAQLEEARGAAPQLKSPKITGIVK